MGLGAMSISCADAGTEPVRQFEVFAGAVRRRDWSDEAKAAIVTESYSGVDTVCAVGRRHGLSHCQLFTWRRQLRRQSDASGLGASAVTAAGRTFVLVATEPPAAERQGAPKRRRSRSPSKMTAAVELEIDGVWIKIARGTDARTMTSVIAALKGSS